MNTWFVTGSSRGLGYEVVIAALEAGYSVVAVARRADDANIDASRDRLLTLNVDITDEAEVRRAATQALDQFGSIDVLVNNAGYGLFGAVEEANDLEVRQIFDVNVFGTLNVTRAILPSMRSQGHGHIVNVGSMGGFAQKAGTGIYGATKFAIEGLTEALRDELAPLGIIATVIEPGVLRTSFLAADTITRTERHIDAYAATAGAQAEWAAKIDGHQPGDPKKVAAAVLELVSSHSPPTRLPLGSDAVRRVEEKLALVRDELDEWRDLALSIDFHNNAEPP